MKTKHLQFVALALMPATCLLLGACTSTGIEQTSAVHNTETSTTFVDTYHLKATVKAVDPATRVVTLASTRGNTIHVKCGPDVINFKQIQVNDVVKVTVSEEISAYLDKNKALGTSGTSSGELAARGATPGGSISGTTQETVKITAIDHNARMVTFRYKNGSSHSVKVEKHINLAKAKVGDHVTIGHTQGVAVAVEKP
jgi:hypothetical protein